MVVTALALLSCTQAEPAPQHVAWKSAKAVTAAQSGRTLGEACSLGELQCASRLCLHYATPDKRVCTKFCGDDSGCPALWGCILSGAHSVCVPPETWQPHRIEFGETQAP
jgi:hypothetical protein